MKMRRLAAEIMELKTQMKTLGMFTNDRELLECPNCDLAEDVSADGLLFTFHRSGTDSVTDSGLRFEEVGKDMFRCPVCGAIQKVEVL